jgi:hypothetical protein
MTEGGMMADERTTEERLDDWCGEVARDVRRAGRGGGSLERYLESVPLGHEKVREGCWEFLISSGGPGVWLRITRTQATIIGAWSSARYEWSVTIDPKVLGVIIDNRGEHDPSD